MRGMWQEKDGPIAKLKALVSMIFQAGGNFQIMRPACYSICCRKLELKKPPSQFAAHRRRRRVGFVMLDMLLAAPGR